MRPHELRLLNAESIEAVPATVARARSSRVARQLSRADWLIRRKCDGRFVAVRRGDVLYPLMGRVLSPALDADLAELAANAASTPGLRPLDGLCERLQALALDEGYGERTRLPLVAEPTTLTFAGVDRYRRPLWLLDPVARAWNRLRTAALRDGVRLEAISGYRSHDYQLGIFERKLARGLSVEEILRVNAAPGYSEHHSGCALDIATPDAPPAEESFERTEAFAWLQQRAGDFGFVLSYPRDNPHGIVYEPWHWCWHRRAEILCS